MKRSKAIEFAKVIFSLFAAALCFVSCSNFDEPVEGFLKSYGQIAKVTGVSYSRGTYSSPGWNNVDSSDDFTLRYHIYNPGNFPLAASLSVSGVADLAAAGITVSVNSFTTISVTYPASYLATVDMDNGGTGDISPSIFLLRATDFYGQSYDTRMLRCNGRPPFISNALSQSFTDAATESSDRLIVCFDLPDLPSDVNLLAVTDTRTGTVHSFAINNGVIATGAEANGWSIDTVPPGTLEETCPDGPVFYHYDGTDYYITTDVQNLKSIDIFDIELSLYDRGGLKSTRVVASRVRMLDPPTCNISSGSTVYNTFDAPYVEMIVTAPANAPDANLSFRITDENGDLVADVNGNTNDCQGSTSFRLYPKADGSAAQYNVGGITAYKQGWWGRGCYLGTIEVVGLKLDDPVADPAPAAGTNFAQDTVVTVTSPQNADLTWAGSASPFVTDPSPVKITLENPGSNLFAFQATKDYYESSDVVNFTYDVVTTKVYVQSGAPASGTGTRDNPVNTIDSAKTILDANGVTDKSANTIYIMGDFINMTGSITVGNPSSYYNIVGVDSNGETIQPVELRLAANGSVIEITTGTIALRYINITTTTASANGAVYIAGGTFILKDHVTIYGNMNGTNASNINLAAGQVINVDAGGLEGTKVGVHTATAPVAGIPVPITSGYGASASKTDTPSQHFVSDVASFGAIFNAAKDDVVLATGGGGIDIGTTYSVAFADSASAGVHTFTATATPTSGGGSPIDITSEVTAWTLKLYYLNTYTGMTSATNTMDLSALGDGTYIMKISAVYGAKTYSGEVKIKIVTAAAIPADFKKITAGSFKRAESSSNPAYTVTLTKDFYMCEHEVTQAEYQAVMGTNPSHFIGDNLPVEKVSWYDAITYCNKKSIADGLTPCYSVSGVTDWATLNFASIPTSSDTTWNAATCDFSKNGYRLPTEAEWEYAALGTYKDNANWNGYGNSSNSSASVFAGYDGSNNIDDYAWYTGTATDSKTHEAKGMHANSYDLYDMSGNVNEWCWDWYGSYASANVSDPTGASPGSNRVYRGGSWLNGAGRCSVAYRDYFSPYDRDIGLGFRVVRNAP